MRPLVVAAFICGWCEAAVVASWRAGGPAAGIEVRQEAAGSWQLQGSAYGPVAVLEPSRDF